MATPERLRVARDLHDGIAQDLVGIGYSLDLLLSDEELTLKARSEIRATRLSVDELVTKVRDEILALRREFKAPFHQALIALSERLVTQIKLNVQVEEVLIRPETESELLAIASEILRNAVTHSGATHIGDFFYPIDNRACLEIVDDGIGGATLHEGRYGIQGITERVEAIDGIITIESMKGTRISILL